jgi:DNA-binding transcriptional LysR family regulator
VLNELNVFVRAVELKSISAAARNLRLSSAAASHRILQLEEQVGARLLNRTTRSLQPTEAGKVFYEHAVEVLRAVERAESSVAKASGVPTGTLRVTAPLGFGRSILAPLVSRFHARYPKVDVRLRLSDHNLDLLAESVDLAIRMTDLPDSSFVARKLIDCPRVLCASPDYLNHRGWPEQPDDLLAHNCLLLRLPGGASPRWTFKTPEGPATVAVAGSFDADASDVLTEWALNGDGIALKPYWEVAAHIAKGDLCVVLPDCPPEPTSLTLLYPHRHLLPAKVRAFADFVAEHIKASIGDVSAVGRSEPKAVAGMADHYRSARASYDIA